MPNKESDWEDAAPAASSDWEDAPAKPTLVEEQSPAFSNWDRAAVQNFAANTQKALPYLQQKHPTYDVRIFDPNAATEDTPDVPVDPSTGQAPSGPTHEPRIYARPKNAKPNDPWHALAPKGFPSNSTFGAPGELGQFAADNAYNLAAGIPAGAAAGAGGVGGALAGEAAGPAGAWVGAKTGAGIAGGAVGGSLEALRQGIGGMMGIPDNHDPSQIYGSTVANAVAPFVFGTNASKAGMTKGVLERLAAGDPTIFAKAGAMQDAQRGIPGTAAGLATKWVGGPMAGLSPSVVGNARANLPAIQAVEKSGGPESLVQETKEQLIDGAYKHQNWLGEQIAQRLDEINQPISIAPAKSRLQEIIQNMQGKKASGSYWTPMHEEELNAAQDLYDAHFKMPNPAYPAAMQKQGAIQSRLNSTMEQLREASAASPSPETDTEVAVLNAQVKGMQAQLGKIPLPPKLVDRPDFMPAKDALDLRNRMGSLGKWTKGTGPNAYKGLNDFEQQVQGAGRSAYKDINEALDRAVDNAADRARNIQDLPGLPDLREAYKQFKSYGNLFRNNLMGTSMASDDATYKLLTNLSSKSNALTRQRLQELDAKLGTNVVQNSDVLGGYAAVGPHAKMVSHVGRGIGAGVGGLAGGLAGELVSGGNHAIAGAAATGGSVLGGTALGLATSPWALRKGLNLGQGVRNAAGFVANPGQLGLRLPQMGVNATAPAQVAPIWHLLQQQEQERNGQ